MKRNLGFVRIWESQDLMIWMGGKCYSMYGLPTWIALPTSSKTAPPRAILRKHEEAEKIRKYRLPAQNIGRTFFKPSVMGADGTPLGIHAAEVIDTLARKLTKQWDINSPNRHGAVRCWIFNRLTFEIIRASSSCLRGYRRNDYAPMVYCDFLFWRPSMNV
jgi:hypothetical protein